MITQQILTFFCAALLIGAAAVSGAAPAKKISGPKVSPMTVSASTRALFQYHRDDASPGKLTTITLNAAHVAAQPVSPNVFGNFIENLHTVIYDTLWADAIHNPSLEKIENGDGEAPWWDQTGAAAALSHAKNRRTRGSVAVDLAASCIGCVEVCQEMNFAA